MKTRLYLILIFLSAAFIGCKENNQNDSSNQISLGQTLLGDYSKITFHHYDFTLDVVSTSAAAIPLPYTMNTIEVNLETGEASIGDDRILRPCMPSTTLLAQLEEALLTVQITHTKQSPVVCPLIMPGPGMHYETLTRANGDVIQIGPNCVEDLYAYDSADSAQLINDIYQGYLSECASSLSIAN